MISRPTVEPTVRAADFARVCARPWRLPPRGPVVPNSTLLRLPSRPPSLLAALAGADAVGAAGRGEDGLRAVSRISSAAAAVFAARLLRLIIRRFAIDPFCVDAGDRRMRDQGRAGRPSSARSGCPAARPYTRSVSRGEGAQGVLYAVAKLAQDGVGNIERILRHAIDADAFAAHPPHHPFDALDQCGRRVLEQQMGLVENEHPLGLFRRADVRPGFQQLRQQPQQERRVQPRRGHEFVGGHGC